MARSNGPSGGSGGKDGKPMERRPGKGNPWAHAKSKAASARSRSTSARSGSTSTRSGSTSSRSGSSGSRSADSPSPASRGGPRPGRRSDSTGDAQRSRPGHASSRTAEPAPFSAKATRESDDQWTNVDGEVLEAGVYPRHDPTLPTVKLQKLLADAGLGSRRELERWIASGRVSVNGIKATLGDRVNGTERIDVDGKALGARARSTGSHARVLLLNKSEGVICTRRDPEGRKTVFADVPTLRGGRWISVGRLDVATTGLLLLTNDGELANRMMHPSTGLDREYAVRTDVVLEDDQLAALKQGIESEGDTLRFADIRYFDGRGANHWYHVVLLEGKNHEVRRLFASVGAEVRRLKRVRYGPVLLPSWLRRGQRFELNNADVAALYKTLGLDVDLPPERPGRRNDRRGMADRSVLIPYPELPSVVGEDAAKAGAAKSGKGARGEKAPRGGKTAQRPASAKTDSVWSKRKSGGDDRPSAGETSAVESSGKSDVWSGAKKAPKSSRKSAVKAASKTAADAGKTGDAKKSSQKKDWRKR